MQTNMNSPFLFSPSKPNVFKQVKMVLTQSPSPFAKEAKEEKQASPTPKSPSTPEKRTSPFKLQPAEATRERQPSDPPLERHRIFSTEGSTTTRPSSLFSQEFIPESTPDMPFGQVKNFRVSASEYRPESSQQLNNLQQEMMGSLPAGLRKLSNFVDASKGLKRQREEGAGFSNNFCTQQMSYGISAEMDPNQINKKDNYACCGVALGQEASLRHQDSLNLAKSEFETLCRNLSQSIKTTNLMTDFHLISDQEQMESLSFPFACQENDDCDDCSAPEKSLFASAAAPEVVSNCKSPLFVRVLDHSLRGYDSFASWMVVSSLCTCRTSDVKLTTYMIDMSSVELTSALQSLFSDHSTLKVTTSQAQIKLIQKYSKLHLINAISVAGQSSDQTLSQEQELNRVLFGEANTHDWRVRPMPEADLETLRESVQNQVTTFIQQITDIDQFLKRSENTESLPFDCPRYLLDLKEELEQWREEKARTFNEGPQFIMSDNLIEFVVKAVAQPQMHNFQGGIEQVIRDYFSRRLGHSNFSGDALSPYIPHQVYQSRMLLQNMVNKYMMTRQPIPQNQNSGLNSLQKQFMKLDQLGFQNTSPVQQRMPEANNHGFNIQPFATPTPYHTYMLSSPAHQQPTNFQTGTDPFFQRSPQPFRRNMASASLSNQSPFPNQFIPDIHNTAGKPTGYVRPFTWDDESVTGTRTERSKQTEKSKVKSKQVAIFEKIGWGREKKDGDARRQTPERQYNQILDNQSLGDDFFRDSDYDENAEVSDNSDASVKSFEFDQNQCLTLFNTLKHETNENMLSPCKQNASPQKKQPQQPGQFQFDSNVERYAYWAALTNINSSQKTTTPPPKKESKENTLTSKVPRTEKEIFKISNANRKKNKLRKKVHKQIEGKPGKDEASQPTSITQLILWQYKLDQKEQGNSSCLNRLRMMSDNDLINHLGWLDPNRTKTQRTKADILTQQQQQQQYSKKPPVSTRPANKQQQYQKTSRVNVGVSVTPNPQRTYFAQGSSR